MADDRQVLGGRSTSPTEDLDALIAGKIDAILERHLLAWTAGPHRDAIRVEIMRAISAHLDWPCVHEEVAVYGLTTRCTSCGVEVTEARDQEHPSDG